MGTRPPTLNTHVDAVAVPSYASDKLILGPPPPHDDSDGDDGGGGDVQRLLLLPRPQLILQRH